MLAVYKDGGRFQKHVDNTAKDGRKLTLLVYLNPEEWKKENGGCLRIHKSLISEEDENMKGAKEKLEKEIIDILPEGGRVAMFLSDSIEHEVMPAYAPRYALTLWYYDMNERHEALKQASKLAQDSGVGNMEDIMNVEAQEKSRDFIDNMFCDFTEDITIESNLAKLKSEVTEISEEVCKIIGSILGVDNVVVAISSLTTETYQELRNAFEKMSR